MAEEKIGYANLEKLVLLGFEMGNVADKMGRSKGVSRYMHLIDLFDDLTGLATVEFKQVKEEVKDLDAEERKALHEKVKAKFDIIDDKLEDGIEKAIALLDSAYTIVKESIALVKELKGEEA